MKCKVGTGKNQICALRDNKGSVSNNMDNIVKVPDEFYRDINSCREKQGAIVSNSRPEVPISSPPITPAEVK